MGGGGDIEISLRGGGRRYTNFVQVCLHLRTAWATAGATAGAHRWEREGRRHI